MPTPPDPVGNDDALRERAQFWIARLVAQDIREAELDRLEAWLAADPRHARAFARERALWQDLAAVSDALLDRPMPAPHSIRPLRPRAFTRRQLMRVAPLALAASMAVAILSPSMMLHLRADHRTTAGEVRSVGLPDGTTAMLDSASAISVAFDGDRRVVHLLAGRAWFDVRHEKRPFLVEALGGVTQDIGTGFEVRREGGAVEVGVTAGSVQVRAAGSRDGPMLHAGNRLRYTADGQAALAPRQAAQLAAWRNGELLLNAQPVKAAIAEIARYRRAPVWAVGDFGNAAPISGLFLIERPDEALETIARMRGLRVMRLPGGVLIIRENSGS